VGVRGAVAARSRTVTHVPAYDPMRSPVAACEGRADVAGVPCTIGGHAPKAWNRNRRSGFPGPEARLAGRVGPNATRIVVSPGQSLAARRAERGLRVRER